MNTTVRYLISVLLVLTFSCNDILEKDLTGEKVELLAPSDQLITGNTKNKFWWNHLEGALWYELQVVSPDFSDIRSLSLDTILGINNFQLSLQPGVYHWRVRALNGSSSTGYTTYSLTITSPSE